MSTQTGNNKFLYAAVQMKVGSNKEENLERAKMLCQEAAHKGARLVCLPEIFNSPYSNDSFGPYSEEIPNGPTTRALKEMAHENGIFLVGGSFPEKVVENNVTKLYNTCLVLNPQGRIIATHRKVHLFDINIPNKMVFQESKTLTSGNSVTVVDLPWCTLGIGICFDLRFPELAQLMRERGANFLIYPGAFNTTTGPLHWHLLARARAVDQQVWLGLTSPACTNEKDSYPVYGHSLLVDPWGKVRAEIPEEEGVFVEEIDMDLVGEVRQSIPNYAQKRTDLYQLIDKTTENKN